MTEANTEEIYPDYALIIKICWKQETGDRG